MVRAASRGALLGAAAAFVVALGDFGASWLWLPQPLDRLELFARLLALEVSVGAIAGALLGGVAGLALPGRIASKLARDDGAAARWERRAWPLPFVLCASPALCAIGWLLFTGGSASRLSMRPLLVAGAALALHAGAYAALRAGRALVERVPSLPRGQLVLLVLALAGLHVSLTKIDQHFFPALYEYLHGALTFSAWIVAGLALGVLALRSDRIRAFDARSSTLGIWTAAILAGVLGVAVWTLGANQTVRVALLSPRAAASRSLMLALGPLGSLGESRASADAVDRARRARQARGSVRRSGGPSLEGAHVLLVTIDALRADHLNTYGYARRRLSANIDRFASESVVFENAYCIAPHSSYSIASLMTGAYLYQRSGLRLPMPEDTLASVLRAARYHAAAFFIDGIFHTDADRLTAYRESRFGFGRYDQVNHDADAMTAAVLQEIDGIVEAGEPPSLVWAHYFDVHEPYVDTYFGTTDIDRYDGEIRKVDRAFGRLLRRARERVTRPLIVLVTADHGEEFRDHGGVYHGSSVYQEQVRVPLIVHVPGMEPRRVNDPVELVDVAPTLLGLLDVPVPPTMRGDDLRPLMRGAASDVGPAFASAGTKHAVLVWPHKLIADLRMGTVELYDLSRDPAERQNLANEQPALVETLRGEISAWLDSLSDANLDPRALALYRGRLADRSAVPTLCEIVLDDGAEEAMRAEAAQLLASIADREVLPILRQALASTATEVAAEAAISLAWLGEDSGRERLRELVEEDPLERRVRAAIGLGRLQDRAAVPVLVESLESDDVEERRKFEAIRLLGLLRDERAIDPLLDLLDDMRMRRRAVLALGRIGDLRAYDAIVEQLAGAQHSTVRESSARALGQIGDRRAIPHLLTAAVDDRLPSVGESLVRLGAVGREVGGVDLSPDVSGTSGIGGCRALPSSFEDWGYLNRTYCRTEAASARITLRVPRRLQGVRTLVLLRARRADAGYPVRVRVRIAGAEVGTVAMDGEWAEHRFEVAPIGAARTDATIEPEDADARLEIDHVLVFAR